MKRIIGLLAIVGLVLAVSCFEPPEYSIVPSITFERVKTVNLTNPQVDDTLIVSVNFKDGDGDLGRSGTENAPPFNQKWYFLVNPIPICERTVPQPCRKSSFIDAGNFGNLVKYSARRLNPNYDTLPPYTAPYSCLNYEIIKDDNNVTIDTVYFQYNPRFYNFFCDIYVKEAGTFEKFDLSRVFGCQPPGLPFYGSFGILGIDGNPDLGLPLEGTIDFKAKSNAMFETILLKNKTVKVKIRIVDRAGNFSNEVESNEFIWK